MLFLLFVIILILGIAGIVLDKVKFDTFWLDIVCGVIAICATVAIVVSGFIMIDSHGNIEAKIAQNNERYESLVYQMENDLYDNDNDLGKKELYNEIREWNEDLAYYQNIQDNFWLGIYYPNVFDQFEYIEYK